MKNYLPHFNNQLDAAVKAVADYVQGQSDRPLNNLILGPPGAGKSFVARQIRPLLIKKHGSKFFRKTYGKLLEFNFADVSDYSGVRAMLEKVWKIQSGKKTPFVLVDEFDVSLQGSSLIRFLINPMYGGGFLDQKKQVRYIKKCVFIFCGSYLRSRPVWRQISGGAAEVNILRLYFDLMMHYRTKGEVARYRQKKEMFDSLTRAQALNAHALNQGVMGYLLKLEKLQDFLSRINGFTIEIPDLSAPLEIFNGMRFHLTMQAFDVEKKSLPSLALTKSDDFQNIYDFWINQKEEDRPYPCPPYIPLISYKTAIVKERLERAKRWLSKNSVYDRFNPEERAYLGTIWLKHGMRSLETICNCISEKRSQNKNTALVDCIHTDIARSHVVENYGGPVKLYAKLRNLNGEEELNKIFLTQSKE